MEWQFGAYRLNEGREELSGPDGIVPIERQPLELMALLLRNHDRVVSKDEIIDTVWQGRAISDAAISTAVKQARRAIGDTGEAQAFIKTVYGRGFRFAAPVQVAAPTAAATPGTSPAPAPLPAEDGKPSIAVLRFQALASLPGNLPLADALPADLIVSLSRLKWLRLIARGSSFRFDPANPDLDAIGAALGVRYVLSGQIEVVGDIVTILTELQSTADRSLIWSDRYAVPLGDLAEARAQIVASVIGALELHLPRHEAEQARRRATDQLDAWGHFHLGLRHMYRFREAENHLAGQHFRTAIELDPGFGRAHSGLSFSLWQNAFMQFGDSRSEGLDASEAAVRRALEIDPDDPFAAYNMGRAHWLRGDPDTALYWYDRALAVNPNFAQCHYARGLGLVLTDQSGIAGAAADTALTLSPLDPLGYAMRSVKALALMAEDDLPEAARLMQEATREVDAHVYIFAIAAVINALNGDTDQAQAHLRKARTRAPGMSRAMLFHAFPFADGPTRKRIDAALTRLGVT